MTHETVQDARPAGILLATDLSARCDRALDRASSLAEQWAAQLVVVHALEQAESFYARDLERRLPSWRRGHDAKRIVEAQLRHDMLHSAPGTTVVVERADPVELVLRSADRYGCGLIVTGIARDETLGRFGLGTTVDRLTRQSPVPVLIVKERVRGPYRNIIVATDFSAASRQALQAALEFFPHDPLTVFHAYHPPMAGLTEDPARYAEQYARVADADCSAFLDSVEMSETRRAGLRRLVEQGQPRELIAHYVEDQGVDLVVLGTHGRGALMQMFVGSVARDILWSLPCDALLVRGRRADTTSPASSG